MKSFFLYQMAPWVRRTFVEVLPKYMFIKRPDQEDDDESNDLDGMYDDAKKAVKSEGAEVSRICCYIALNDQLRTLIQTQRSSPIP